MILWKGHCSVHGRFSEDVVDELRAKHPGINVLVHPECKHEVVLKADLVGSTEFIIKTIEAAEPGTVWAIGTELNLVKRLADAHPDKTIVFLDRNVCYCSTMNRIDLPHLVWALGAWSPAPSSTGSPSTPTPRPTRSWRSSGCSTCPASRTATERPGATTMARRRISDSERRSRIAVRHALAPAHRLADVAAVTRAMTVLHATEAATVHLAVAARAEGVKPEDVDAELYDARSVVKQLAMRRTLFVFPRELLPAAWGSASARVATSERKRIAKADRRRRHRPRRGGVARRRPRRDARPPGGGTGDHRRAAGPGPGAGRDGRRHAPTRPGTGPCSVAPWVLTHLGLEGKALRGRNAGHWRLNKPTWTTAEDWLGVVDEPLGQDDRLRRAGGPVADHLRPRHRGRHPVVAGVDEDRLVTPGPGRPWAPSRSTSTTATTGWVHPDDGHRTRSSRGRRSCRRSTPP